MSWPDPQRFAEINHALTQALALEDAERADWVERWGQCHPELVAQLKSLLQSAALDESCLTQPLTGALVEAMSFNPGAQLGDWRLLRRLGEGGMAEVWLARGEGAHQDQHAAIKRPLLPGAADPDALARFGAERRRLAALSDARIARLIDSGMDPQGQPWFAMEYVDGQRIDQYCDTHRLPLRERMHWLREVALAVHSAHQALVVHRDLKPANVLITRSNPQVKLLDFGIAKDLDGDAAPTLNPALTPQYASPEQLRGGPITIASDVYQLGLLLFELATGCRPATAQRLVSDDRGSTVPTMAEAVATASDPAVLAERRATSVQALVATLRGDLAAILEYATALDPARRYPSASALAEDLAAWIAGLPVRARTPSTGYRLRRFVGRHAWACGIVALLLAGLATALLLYLQQVHRRGDEARASMQVQAYLINLLRQADPLFSGKPEVAPGPLLESSLVLARGELREQPGLLADVLLVGADAHMRRADYATGGQLLAEALALPLEPKEPRRLQLLARMGQSLHYQSRYAEAEQYLREALPLWQANGLAGNLAVPASLADVLHSRGDYRAALEVLTTFEPAADKSYARLVWHRDLGTVLRDAGQLDAARAHLEAAWTASTGLPGDHGTRGTVLLALSRLEALAGNAEAAEQAAIEGMAIARTIYGEHQAVPGMFRHSLALAAELKTRHAQAAALLDIVLAQDYARVARGNVLIAYARLDRAWILARLGRDPEPDLRLAQATLLAVHPAGHPRLSEVHLLRALVAEDPAEADRQLAQALAVRVSALGLQHPLTLEAAAWRQQVRIGTIRSIRHALDAASGSQPQEAAQRPADRSLLQQRIFGLSRN